MTKQEIELKERNYFSQRYFHGTEVILKISTVHTKSMLLKLLILKENTLLNLFLMIGVLILQINAETKKTLHYIDQSSNLLQGEFPPLEFRL